MEEIFKFLSRLSIPDNIGLSLTYFPICFLLSEGLCEGGGEVRN